MKTSLRPALLCLIGTLGLTAATTTVWELNTYQNFVKGRFEGISLSRDGRLQLAPKLDTLFTSEQPAIWSVAKAQDGTLYAGTGHRGRLYRIDPAGRSSLIWTAEQPEIFAVAVDPKGSVYAATSPDGKIYKLENGTAAEYYDPKSKYIWALAFDPDGVLYAGTGDQGNIFRITGRGQGEVYYQTGQAQVTCLAFDRQGRLLAGSEPNGIIYQISAKDRAFVLYDSNLPEIRSIVAGPDGSLYAAALGGSIAKRTAGAAQGGAAATGVTAAPTTVTVTVTDANAQAGLEVKPSPEAPKPSSPPAATSAPYTPVVDMMGVERSALYKIHADNTVETLWTSKEENVYDLLSSGGQLVFSTDAQGRVYRLSPDRKATLLWQTNEGQATQLLEYQGRLLAATGEMGKLLLAGKGSEASGSYTSPVHDAGSVARWGRLNWRADVSRGGRIEFRTRSGNSARPDRTWSEWSQPIGDPANSLIRSPNARYIQWRAEFRGAPGEEPAIESVTLAYLPQNTPPTVSSVNVVSQPSTSTPAKAAPQPASTGVYSITVTDTGEDTPSTDSGTPTQNLSRAGGEQIQLSWQAEDKDGDRLAYSAYFRGQDEREWKALRTSIAENSLTLDSDAFADGRYLFRVVASDRPSNAGDTAREGEMVSAPVLIDNTPPALTLGAPVRKGQQVEITVDAQDGSSDLRRCEFSRNARPWLPVEAVDGVTDSQRERFVIRLEDVPSGEQLIVVRVYDAAGNAGLAKVVLR
jgi:sugar lactone lactonase YvrE